MTTWFTSDLHLGHEPILEFTNRRAQCPLSAMRPAITEHDEWVIGELNYYVKPTDELYILGDVSFHKKWHSGSLIESINGKKHLVLGNHDQRLADFYQMSGLFASVSILSEFKLNRKRVICCHYPIAQWSAGHHGSWMLHGHTHGDFDYEKANLADKRILDVGFDNAYRVLGTHRPFSFEDITILFEDRVSIEHHGKAD
jgi:calcineurin-like phosphoesterase family protein